MEVTQVKVRTHKLAVFVTCLGIAGAFPVFSSADKGGIPHSKKQCKTHRAHKKKPKKPAPNSKGRKCGFVGEPTPTTTVTTVAAPTLSTTTTTTTTSSP